MNASRLHRRLQSAALVANVATFAVHSLIAPAVLLLEPNVAAASLEESARVHLVIVAVAAVATALRMRAFARRLRAVEFADTSTAIENAARVRMLHRLPLSWVIQLLAQSVAIFSIVLIPELRPTIIDRQTQLALVLLAATVAVATTLPLFVAARALVGQALEAVPWPLTEEAARRGQSFSRGPTGSSLRVRGRLLLAVALPVAVVAFGAVLLADAHVRASMMRSRRDDADVLARGVLEAEGDVKGAGRNEAISAARKLGYEVDITADDAAPPYTTVAMPTEGGARVLRVRLDGAIASVRFQPTRREFPWSVYGVATAAAIAVAAFVGRAFGKAVSIDLEIATREVRLLGTRDVLRGVTRVGAPARFEVVAALGAGVEAVAARFRQFARGQERMIDARERAQRMRELFLASMSHDLRSPLNSILGFVTLIQKAELTEGQHESLAIVERRGRELLELIENILNAAKIEAGRLELQRDWIAPGDILNHVVRRGRELAEEKSGGRHPPAVEVVGELQPGIPGLYVDGPRMTQAIVNLVANAVKFVDRGVVRVRIAKGAMMGEWPGLKFEVEDQGRGIPEEDFEQIFQAFRQPLRSRRYGGLGLGLSMTRAIAELHGGTIDVSSSPERGSVFTVNIPMVAMTARGEFPSIPPPRSSLRVPTLPPFSRPPSSPGVPRASQVGPLLTGQSSAPDTPQHKHDEEEFPTVQMPALEIVGDDDDDEA